MANGQATDTKPAELAGVLARVQSSMRDVQDLQHCPRRDTQKIQAPTKAQLVWTPVMVDTGGLQMHPFALAAILSLVFTAGS
jgi:hypothetical protein